MKTFEILVNSALLSGAKTELIFLGIAVAAFIGAAVLFAASEIKKIRAAKKDD